MKTHLTILISVVALNFSFAQTKEEINLLLNEIAKTKDSKDIAKTESAKKLVEYGAKLLPTLSAFFIDQTKTNVESECIERNLTKGEIAIIMADRIEGMPYAIVTGVQNCSMTFCEKNTNYVEIYLPYINLNGIEKFQAKYNEWLVSNDRIMWQK